jgi:cation-transporting ATPase E
LHRYFDISVYKSSLALAYDKKKKKVTDTANSVTNDRICLVCFTFLWGMKRFVLMIAVTLLSACGVGIPTVILQLEPSFERAEGSFLLKALKKAIPSACTVMLSVFVCLALQKYMNLSPQRYSGLLMVLTGFIYMYTLVRVYQPMTKLRAAVISAMSCLLIGAVFLAGSVFDAKLLWSDLLIALCAVAVIPVVITGFSRILELAWGFVTKQLPEKK